MGKIDIKNIYTLQHCLMNKEYSKQYAYDNGLCVSCESEKCPMKGLVEIKTKMNSVINERDNDNKPNIKIKPIDGLSEKSKYSAFICEEYPTNYNECIDGWKNICKCKSKCKLLSKRPSNCPLIKPTFRGLSKYPMLPETEWLSRNPIMNNGAFVISGDLLKLKVGNGESKYSSLPFIEHDSLLLKNNYYLNTTIPSELPNGPYMVPMMNSDGIITNIATNVCLTYTQAIDYARENTFAFSGQALTVILPDDKTYEPSIYIIKNAGEDIASLYFAGHALYKGIFRPCKEILKGTLCTYRNEDYMYDGQRWVSITNNKFININNIKTPDDIIKAFDALQKRATELGYPIKVFSKNKPIHPGPSHNPIDLPISLIYDKSDSGDNIMVGFNIKDTLENIISRGDKNE